MSREDASHILYGGFEGTDREVCDNTSSFGEFMQKNLIQSGSKVILVDGVSGKEFTAKQLLEDASHLALRLRRSFGIKSGDVITICSENRVEFALTLHAAFLLGVTVAPINVSYTEYEMKHAVGLSKPKIVFTSPEYFGKCFHAFENQLSIEHFVIYGVAHPPKAILNLNIAIFWELMRDKSIPFDFVCEPQNIKERVAFIFMSSGTTGLPKGVQITQFNLMMAYRQYTLGTPIGEYPPNATRIILGNLPWFHAYGTCTFTIFALSGFKYVFLPRFKEEDFLRCIQEYKVNTLYVVPPIMVLLAKSPLVDRYDLSSVHIILCGAAPLSKEIAEEVKKRIGFRFMRQGYGMTEGTYAFCKQSGNHAFGSVGKLLVGIYGKVVDIESGKSLGPNQRGEIHLKSPCLMKGYIGNPEATSSTIDKNGWLHTGDVGYYDCNAEFYIVDRIKELIKYKGFQVPPAEIEALLLTHKHIKDTGVVGIPDDLCGEKAFAFVVRQPKSKITEKEIIQYVAERISVPKQLHGGLRFVDEIPKNPSGKILRRVLRELVKKPQSKL